MYRAKACGRKHPRLS